MLNWRKLKAWYRQPHIQSVAHELMNVAIVAIVFAVVLWAIYTRVVFVTIENMESVETGNPALVLIASLR